MTRIATSLAVIILVFQFAPSQTRGQTNKPEPLDSSSSTNVAPPTLPSLLEKCRGNQNEPNPPSYLHCDGEAATRLFQMLGNPPFNIPAIEKPYNGKRYLERSLKTPKPDPVCWARVEVSNGDPIVSVFYDCAVTVR